MFKIYEIIGMGIINPKPQMNHRVAAMYRNVMAGKADTLTNHSQEKNRFIIIEIERYPWKEYHLKPKL